MKVWKVVLGNFPGAPCFDVVTVSAPTAIAAIQRAEKLRKLEIKEHPIKAVDLVADPE